MLSINDLSKILSKALKNHDDFIITCEPKPNEINDPDAEQVIHIMTGNLITPCRLNALKGKVISDEDEGARIITIKEIDLK